MASRNWKHVDKREARLARQMQSDSPRTLPSAIHYVDAEMLEVQPPTCTCRDPSFILPLDKT